MEKQRKHRRRLSRQFRGSNNRGCNKNILMPAPSNRFLPVLLLLLLSSTWSPSMVSLALSTSSGAGTVKTTTRIQVCQNKDCCRRFQAQSANLAQVVRDLLPSESSCAVETTGCLSQCDKGPNLQVSRDENKDESVQLLHGVTDHIQAAAQLQAAVGLAVPPKLIAAVTVLEKVHKSSSPQEKEKCASSVIRALSGDEILVGCSAHTRALVVRAEVHLDAGRYQEALQDAQQSLDYYNSDPSLISDTDDTAAVTVARRAYRVSADAHQGLGNVEAAVQCLQSWAAADPSFRTKITKEIRQLQDRAYSV